VKNTLTPKTKRIKRTHASAIVNNSKKKKKNKENRCICNRITPKANKQKEEREQIHLQ
jgi:hypothetical protein